ncbi:hypothetical protein B7463_g4198, partial [Scytalidium lignicola]
MGGYQYSHITEDETEQSFKNTWMEYRIRLPIVLVVFLVQLLLFVTLVLIFALKQSAPELIGRNLRDVAGNYYPAAEVLKYRTLIFEYNSTFMTMEGVPSAKTDLAWSDMQERHDTQVFLPKALLSKDV